MQEPLIQSAVTGLFTIAGSVVTAVITYVVSGSHKKLMRYRKRLLRSQRDNLALCNLERYYTQELAKSGRTPEAWKREIRGKMREDGIAGPSQSATAARLERSIAELA